MQFLLLLFLTIGELPNAATEMRQAAIDANDLQPSHYRYASFYTYDDPGRGGRALSYSMNSLSWNHTIKQVDEVTEFNQATGSIFRTHLIRFDLTQYSTRENLPQLLAAWERLYDREPYFNVDVIESVPYVRKQYGRIVERFNKTVTSKHPVHAGAYLTLQRQCKGTKLPIVRGDWLINEIWTNSEVYYDLGRIGNTLQEFSKQLGVDVDALIDDPSTKSANLEKRAPTKKCGRLSAINGPHGLYTIAFDINDTTDPAKNPFRNPGRDFKFDGSEVVAEGPNNLAKYFIADAIGKRILEVPAEVARYDYAASFDAVDAPINAGFSCMNCHNRNEAERCFKFFDNEQRQLFDAVTRYDKDLFALEDLYAKYDTSYLGKRMIASGYRINDATMKACGLTSFGAASAVRDTVQIYRDTLVDLKTACKELGVTEDQFKAAVQSHYARELAALVEKEPYAFSIANGMRCSRGAWISGSYSFMFQVLYNGQ